MWADKCCACGLQNGDECKAQRPWKEAVRLVRALGEFADFDGLISSKLLLLRPSWTLN